MFFHQKVNVTEINPERLDADFYKPEYITNSRLLKSTNFYIETLSDVAGRIACGPFGSDLPSNLYKNEGIPLYRVQNVRDGLISNEGLVFLDKRTSDELKSCQFRTGDLLIAKTGLLGRVAFVPSDVDLCNVTQDVIGVSVNQERADSYYLSAFFSSKVGQPQIIRWGQGNVQQHLNMPSVRNFFWIKINRRAQTYIGDKVRWAEQLREQARELEEEANSFFKFSNKTAPCVGERISYRTKQIILKQERLDAPHYDPAHLFLEELLVSKGAINLSNIAKQVRKTWDRKSEEFFYLEIGEIDLSNGSIKPTRMLTKDAPSRAQLLVEPYDVLVATVRPNRKNVALVLNVDENLPIIASTGFSVLRFPSVESAVFYHGWLRSDAATQQLLRWNAGGAYPAIDDDIAISTLTPKYSEDIVLQKGQKWLLKFKSITLTEQLTTAAKLLVEALIEGKLTEAELINAQKALEKGDIDPDWKIMSRLTRKGIDVKDEPAMFLSAYLLYDAVGKWDIAKGEDA